MRSNQKKHFAALIFVIITTAVVFSFASKWINDRPLVDTTYGITFSTFYSDQLGLSYQSVYKALVEELGVKYVRLPIYWSEVQGKGEQFDWTRYDWLFAYSQAHGLIVTPVIGEKVPRWPECFIPDWVEGLDKNAHQTAVLNFIESVVERYKDNSSIIRWQVENEPFFPFGICPSISSEDYQERVDLVRKLDDKPIQITVSGEIGPWIDQAQEADVLGFSLYRQTWNDAFGYFVYPLSPEYYFFRSKLVDSYVDDIVVSELQAEPWFPESIGNRSPADWYEVFTAEMLQENINFANQTGVSETYFWGAEWWYYLKNHNESRLWGTARKVF